MRNSLLVGVALTCCVGCAGPSGQTGNATVTPTLARSDNISAGRQGVGADRGVPNVSIPKNATMTILCRDFTGPSHASDAKQAKLFAEQAAGEVASFDSSFYIVHGENRSVLYHGFYETIDVRDDKREGERAQRAKAVIESMETAGLNGVPIKAFGRAIFVPLEQPDPVAPTVYDLRNSDAFWTVAIAVYTDPAQRKQAAVESVAAARKQGIDAYFLHKGNFSYVTIGAWPESAIKRGVNSRDALESSVDPVNPRPIVVSSGKLPDRLRNLTDKAGRRAATFEVQLEINDPTLMATMRRYDYDVDGYQESEEPLLVNVPESLGREVAKDEAPIEAPRAVDIGKTLIRPAGL